jgi:hypothetical protein
MPFWLLLVPSAADFPDPIPHRWHLDAERLQRFSRGTNVLPDEAEQNVLSADVPVFESPGFFLR